MATENTVVQSWPPSRWTKPVHDYGARFKTKIPAQVMRQGGESPSRSRSLLRALKHALSQGRPVPEWEAMLERARSTAPGERTVQQIIDAEPLPGLPEDLQVRQGVSSLLDTYGNS